jgi:hypothetical protein
MDKSIHKSAHNSTSKTASKSAHKKKDALIILDWDDTLFPTTWVIKNRIDLNKEDVRNKHIAYFSKLDTLLFDMLSSFLSYGSVFIVTNAMIKWVKISSKILPNTGRLISKKIEVLSAREMYQKELPKDMYGWKRLLFKGVVDTHYKNNNSRQNIISAGDAEYEFKALINLWNKDKKNRLLKTIRLLRYPSFDSLVDQLQVISNSLDDICNKDSHMDLKFDKMD